MLLALEAGHTAPEVQGKGVADPSGQKEPTGQARQL